MMLLFWRATHSVSMFPAEMTEAERKRATVELAGVRRALQDEEE